MKHKYFNLLIGFIVLMMGHLSVSAQSAMNLSSFGSSSNLTNNHSQKNEVGPFTAIYSDQLSDGKKEHSDLTGEAAIGTNASAGSTKKEAYSGGQLPIVLDLKVTALSWYGPFCLGSKFTIYFETGNTVYGPNNVFTAQLGNAGGNWPNFPDVLGNITLSGTKVNGQIEATIPYLTAVGSLYNIRIVASDPLIGGIDYEIPIRINPPPADYTVSGSASFCPGDAGSPVELSDSETGVNYQLYYTPTNSSLTTPVEGALLAGTGSSLNFGNQNLFGTYTILATNPTTTCSNSMKGSAIMTQSASPVAGTLTKSPDAGNVCENTLVSAILSPGSGGTNATDILQFGYDGTGVWNSYTSGNSLSTSNHTLVEIRTYRTSTAGCPTSEVQTVSWIINPPSNAGVDQLTISGTSAILAANTSSGGTGEWTIINGSGGSFGVSATSTSSNPSDTFNGVVGVTYTLQWTVTNGACVSSDQVQVLFNPLVTTISTISPTITYGSGSVTLSATVSPDPGTGSVDFYIAGTKVGTGAIGAGGVATYTYDPSSLDASTYTISAIFIGNGNYYTSSTDPGNNGVLTISKATATLALGNLIAIYDGQPHSATASTSPAGLSGVTISGTGTNAGTYPATASLDNPNYTAVPVSGSLVITKATATLALGNLTAIYDGLPHSATASTSPTGLSGVTVSGTGTDAGTYPATASLENPNYTATPVSGSLVITKATTTLALGNLTAIYDGQPHSATASTSPEGLSGVTVSGTGTNAGTYPATASLDNPNYTAVPVSGSLVITKATATLALGNLTAIYDGQPHSATASTSPEGLSGVTVSGTGTNAGTYPATASLDNPNYTAAPVSGSLVITKATATLALGNLTAIYDGQPHSATASTSPEGLSGVTVSGTGTNAGTYPATASLDNPNYTAVPVSGSLVITKAIATLSLANLSAIYDGQPHSATASTSPVGLSGVTVSGTGTNAGTYPATASLNNPNYTATPVSGSLVISPRSISITADPQGKIYGDSDPALTYQITNGSLALNDVISGLLTRDPGENAGSYIISQGGLSLGNNYAITFINAELTIAQRSIEITADMKAKAYSETDPQFTYSITSGVLQFGNTFSGSLSREAGEAVGTYAIWQGTLSLGNNYDLTYRGANLTIGTIAVTITAADKSKVYGDIDPELTYSITSGALQPGDSFTGLLTRAPGENVGTYIISQGNLTLDAKYSLTFVPATLSINTKTITITAAYKCKTYGAADRILTYTITNGALEPGDSFTGSLTRDPGEDVGLYAIRQGTVSLNGNYSLVYIGANHCIVPRPVTITADAKSKTYGDPDPPLTYAITSGALYFADTFSGDLVRAVGEAVGVYPIAQGTVSLSSNYILTYAGNNLTIGTRALTITADAQSKTYGDSDPPLTYQITSGNLVNGDSFTGSLARATGESVGAYAINQGNLALNSNYLVNFTGADLTITYRAITITADAKTKMYGDADPSFTYSVTSGTILAGDSFTGSLARATGESIGTYAINQGTVVLNSNYLVNFTGADLTIANRAITITADAKTKIYGEADPALTYSITSGTIQPGDSFSGSLARAAGESAGTYAINQGTLVFSGNYLVNFTGADLTVASRAITITADAKNKVYGDADPALTYSVTSGTIQAGDSFTGSLARATGENIGTYAISQGTLGLSGNYLVNFTGADLTIGNRAITITADAKNKVYGEADPALTYSVTSGTIQSGDSFTGSLARATGETVGAFAINQGNLALNSNYLVNFTGADLTITYRAITITADSKTKMYGDADPSFTYSVTSGTIQAGDSFTGSLARTTGESVGTYAINQGNLALNSNYLLNFTGADLTIGNRIIIITADSKSKVYGETDPALTYSVTSGTLQAGDSFTGSLARATGESVGAYAINQGNLALNSNYVVNFTGANLTIGNRAITITADAKNKIYGDADPALTYSVTSGTIQPGDSFTGSLARVAGEGAGAYAINQGDLGLNSNYVVNFTGADLTIEKRVLIVTADSQTKVYGSANPVLSLTYNGFSGSDNVASLLPAATANTAATLNSPAGAYAITVSGAASGNYDFIYVAGILQVTTASLTITADNKSRLQGMTNPELTVSYSGFVNGEDKHVLLNQPFTVTSATGSSAPGDYRIIVSEATAANYNITFVNGVFTVIGAYPRSIVLSQGMLFENQPNGTYAGTLSSTSDDPAGSFTYTLVSGSGDTDNGLFTVSGNQVSTATPLNYEQKAIYTIRVRSTNQYGLSLETQLYINLTDINEVPTLANITDQRICFTTSQQSILISGISAGPEINQAVALTLASSNNQLLEDLTINQTSGANAEIKYRVKSGASGTTSITVFITDNGETINGGVNTFSQTFTITVNPAPIIIIAPDKGSEISKGETLKLTASGGSTYSWSNSGGIITGQNSNVLTVRPIVSTTYKILVTNAQGCLSEQEITIKVTDDMRNVIGHNILSPNGDGVNDRFVIDNIDMYDNTVQIFDRAGRMLYTKKNYANDWEGTYNNQLLAEDTYYYIADFGKGKAKLKGFITIVRD